MQLTDSPAISINITVHWAIGSMRDSLKHSLTADSSGSDFIEEVYGLTFVNLRRPSDCTVGLALERIRDTVVEGMRLPSSSTKTDPPRRDTLGNLVQQKTFGTVVEISHARIKLRGMFLPRDADREACLPVPKEEAKWS